MTAQRKSAKLQLRRSISEQLRDSTSKAWDLLWRNVRERRLAELRLSLSTVCQKRRRDQRKTREICRELQLSPRSNVITEMSAS
ncbi:Rho GTPase-activating protein 7 Deleted in liver cancer 1 protein -like protein [Channa argus]|uniref:Rho GTPase-activating protein 7 Deleted in liver cancer 1 protein-like protein n=1 Tax=Channa argus TaxID=215402 RepID=A0A6G1QSU6_CHAAH|nr:Rho GTPase-activating protein 7 Deleted in liver cancer 1 protein -like protein [Channa argus]